MNNDTLMMHARTGSRPICVDDTHTSMFGAAVNAYLVANDIKESASELSCYLKDEYDNPLEHVNYWLEKSLNKVKYKIVCFCLILCPFLTQY